MSLSQAERSEMVVLENRIQSHMRKDWLDAADRADYDAASSRLSELQSREDAASPSPMQSFGPRDGDGAPAPDPNLSVPVPPASGVDMGTGVGPDLSVPIEKAPPVPGQTVFLPLTGASQYDDTIRAVDRAMAEVNDQAFNLNPDDMWMPDGAHLGGPSGPATISGLSPVADKMRELTGQITEQFSALGDTINAPRDGTWPKRLQEMYKPTLDSANEGVAQGGPASNATDLTGEAGGGASGTFGGFQKAISNARYAIANLYGVDEQGNPYLDTSRALALDPSVLEETKATMQNMVRANTDLSTAIDPWNIRTRLTGDSESTGDVTPASSSPTPPSPSSSSGGFSSGGGSSSSGGGLKDQLDDLLGAQPATPAAAAPAGGSSSPQMPQMPSMGGMPQMPQMPSMGDMLPQDAEKALKAGDTEMTSDTNAAEARPHSGTPAHSAASAAASAAAPEGTAATNAVIQNAIPKPGDPVRPGALGADGKLLDKDGDGRMDKDALAATRENADHNNDGIRDKFSITIDAANRSVDVVMDDPRLAEMMTRLAEGSNGNAVDILDAAKASGLDIDNLGEKIDTMAIRPGDVVTGTDRGMYLGDGLVLTEQGEVKSLVDVMDFRVSDPEVFRLPVPDLPSSDEVLPEAAVAAAADPSPEPKTEPQAPTAAAEPAPAPSPAPAAAPEPPADDALSAMLAGSSGGGPAEVAYQGHAMGGAEDSAASEGPSEVAYQGRALG